MTPAELLAAVRSRGADIVPKPGGELAIRGPTDARAAVLAEMRERLRAVKPELHALRTATPPFPAPPAPLALGDLPPGLLAALRESGATLHVFEEQDAAVLVVQPWAALPSMLQEDAR